MEIEEIITGIADALMGENPHPTLVYAARYVLTEYEREDIPDWVAVLAGGNVELWKSVIDEARRWMAAEEAENASNDDNDE